ncbi:MAG: heparan-alpha-glucosaminide N-acetyltransferase domain-containing protein, partial [Actinomycetes bacterium]
MSQPIQPTRLAGVDAARGLAVLGMIITHVAITSESTVVAVADGRSSILFAMLAGVSLSLLTGGRSIHPALGVDRRRLAVRAGLLFVLGLLLEEISSGPFVILCYYAVMFLLALPLLRVRPALLLGGAAVWAVVGPLLSYGLRASSPIPDPDGIRLTFADFTSLPAIGDAAGQLLVTGIYPVLTWMPFLLAGIAVGRLDLRSTAVRVRLLVGGVTAAVMGYGGSWLALNVLGGQAALLRGLTAYANSIGSSPNALLRQFADLYGTVPAVTPAFLLVDTPHSGTPFEIIGSGGVAISVLAGCLLVAGPARVALLPLTSVGALALTVYAGHILVLGMLPYGTPWVLPNPWPLTIGFLGGAIAFAWLWRSVVGRGPLERLVHSISLRAAGGA